MHFLLLQLVELLPINLAHLRHSALELLDLAVPHLLLGRPPCPCKAGGLHLGDSLGHAPLGIFLGLGLEGEVGVGWQMDRSNLVLFLHALVVFLIFLLAWQCLAV